MRVMTHVQRYSVFYTTIVGIINAGKYYGNVTVVRVGSVMSRSSFVFPSGPKGTMVPMNRLVAVS